MKRKCGKVVYRDIIEEDANRQRVTRIVTFEDDMYIVVKFQRWSDNTITISDIKVVNREEIDRMLKEYGLELDKVCRGRIRG